MAGVLSPEIVHTLNEHGAEGAGTTISRERDRRRYELAAWSIAKIKFGRGGHRRPIGDVIVRARKEMQDEPN